MQFSHGVNTLLHDEDNLKTDKIFLEVGPGNTLSTLVKKQLEEGTHYSTSVSAHPKSGTDDQVAFELAMGDLWRFGVEINWQGSEPESPARRVRLPSYPFERRRYWIDPPGAEELAKYSAMPVDHSESRVNRWQYQENWQLTYPDEMSQQPLPKKRVWIVLSFDNGFREHLLTRLQGEQVVIVTPGSHFFEGGEGQFIINPHNRDDWQQLMTTLKSDSATGYTLVHGGGIEKSMGDQQGLRMSDYAPALIGFYHLARVFQDLMSAADLHIELVTTATHKITGLETLCADSAMAASFCRVLQQEYENISSHVLDISDIRMEQDPEKNLASIACITLQEISLEKRPFEVSYREGQRWQKSYQLMSSEPELRQSIRVKKGGVYLILGGMGRIALALAEYIAIQNEVTLVLVGRTPLPEKSKWDTWLKANPDDRKMDVIMDSIKKIESMGSVVATHVTDICDDEEMQRLIGDLEESYGPLNGVIHGAGSFGQSLQLVDKMVMSECEDLFRAKVLAMHVLDRALADRTPDFCILLSSLSSVVGGWGILFMPVSIGQWTHFP